MLGQDEIKWMRLVVSLLIMSATLYSKSTSQSGDILIIGGDTLCIMDKPLYYTDPESMEKWEAMMPSQQFRSTHNYSGYTAYWTIKDGCLMLDSVHTEVYDPVTDTYPDSVFNTVKLKDAFGKYYYDGKIVATWYTRALRTIKGNCIKYVHDGWESLYEEEKFFDITDGILTDVKEYHNHHIPGITMDEVFEILRERFPYQDFAKYAPFRFTFLITMGYDETKGSVIASKVELPRCRIELTEEDKDKLFMTVMQIINSIESPIESLYYMGKHLPIDDKFIMPITLREDLREG